MENHWCAEPSKCIAFLHLLNGRVTGKGESIRVIRFLLFGRISGVLGDKHLNFCGLRDGRRIIETAWYSYVKVSLGLKYICTH